MAVSTVNTVAGPVTVDMLGKTLIHEHVFVQYGGSTLNGRTLRDEVLSACTGFAEAVKRFGVATVVDPTTVDLGRDTGLLVDVSRKTGLNILCATGIYSIQVYRDMRGRFGGSSDAVSELFLRELTEGIDGSGIKAGVVKVVTGSPAITADEEELLRAAGKAAAAAGVPVITHTEGVLGEEQQEILCGEGVLPQRVIVGHSCISTDFSYHERIIKGGSYLGFDRFGMEGGMPDEVRAASLLRLVQAGYHDRLVVSHDSVWHWVNGPQIGTGPYRNWTPTNFFKRVIPMLHYGGATEEQIDTMLRDNPRRIFDGGQL